MLGLFVLKLMKMVAVEVVISLDKYRQLLIAETIISCKYNYFLVRFLTIVLQFSPLEPIATDSKQRKLPITVVSNDTN